MRIKQRIDDFRVRELLAPDFLAERGEYRVYRVTKRKLTSMEAARELAYAAGVQASDVALAGLKDRQGVTTQFMTIRRGRDVDLRALDLTVESVGFAREGLESRHSLGNAFEVALRGLMQEDLDVLRDNVPVLRDCGVINYFDEQRFGNLRHNQGWIAQQLMRGEHEAALQRLLASISDHDDGASTSFKRALQRCWGDWSACRDVAGRFGQHHSVFEHLKQHDGDFAGAFYHVSSRLRLIHLYAFQSHIWNRAVTDCVASMVPREERVVLEGVEGPLVYPSRPLPLAPDATFRLPGPCLEDVRDPRQRGWLEDALARERMVAADFQVQGVSGFQLKGEERALRLEPRHLRVRPPERDNLNFDAFVVKVRFELQRGAYATLVVRRLLSTPMQAAGRERGADRGQRDARGARKSAPPEHRESGESLAPKRFQGRGGRSRGDRGFHGEGWGQQADRGSFQRRSFERGDENRERRPDHRHAQGGAFDDRRRGPGERSRGFDDRNRDPGERNRGFDDRSRGGSDDRGRDFDARNRGGSGERGGGSFEGSRGEFGQRGQGFDPRRRGFDNRGDRSARPDRRGRGDSDSRGRGASRDES